MIERIELEIVAQQERHTVSLEQGIFSIDGVHYRTLDTASSLLVAVCMQQPGVSIEWADITDMTGISARRVGYEAAEQLAMDYTVSFRNPGQSGQSFVSAIFPKIPSKRINGSIAVKGMSGLRFNNRISANSTIFDIEAEDGGYSYAAPHSDEPQPQRQKHTVTYQREPEDEEIRRSELLKFMRPGEVYSLQRFIDSLRDYRGYHETVTDDTIRAELARLVQMQNDHSLTFEVKMIRDNEGVRFMLVRKKSNFSTINDVSMGSQLNTLM